MPRKENEDVPEGNSPILQQEEFGSGQPTMEVVYRMMREAFDRWDRKLDEILAERRSIDQRLTHQEHGARQPRLAVEAGGPANTKTRERTEGPTSAVQAMRGDSFPACRVGLGPMTNSTNFGSTLQGRRFGRGRRIRAHGVSPNLGDALTISRRWFGSHWQNLHSDGDHLQRATSSVPRDRGDESKAGNTMDFNSIRLVRQQLLDTTSYPLPEGYQDKIQAK